MRVFLDKNILLHAMASGGPTSAETVAAQARVDVGRRSAGLVRCRFWEDLHAGQDCGGIRVEHSRPADPCLSPPISDAGVKPGRGHEEAPLRHGTIRAELGQARTTV